MDRKVLECPINEYGDTALIVAAENHCENAVKLLLEAGADPNAVNSTGENALIKAFWNIYGNRDGPTVEQVEHIIRYLLEAGADVNLKNKNGWSPLMAAVCEKKIPEDVICEMIGRGADINARDNHGRSICSLALECRHTGAAKLLAAAGADMSTPDDWGNVPLHYAVANCPTRVMCYLILMGADTEMKNNYGVNPMEKLKAWNEDKYSKVIKQVERYREKQLKEADMKKSIGTGFEFDI